MMEINIEGQQVVSLSIGAKVIDSYKTVDTALSENSVNPVENRVIAARFNEVNSVLEDLLGYEVTEEDLSSHMLKGWWRMKPADAPEGDTESVGAVGTQVVPTKVWDGTWRSLEYNVRAGEKYKITGTGGLRGRLYAVVSNDGTLVALAPSSFSATDYILDIAVDGKMYLSFFVNGGANAYSAKKIITRYERFESISEEIEDVREETNALQGEIDEIDSAIDGINNILEELRPTEEVVEDITSQFTYYAYKFTNTEVGTQSIPTQEYFGFRGIRQTVKAGEWYDISGAGGDAYRLYCLVDQNNVILKIANVYETRTNFRLDIEQDGILYVNHDASKQATFSVIKHSFVVELPDYSGTVRRKGTYEFGRTCNCDYTSPEIQPWPWEYPNSDGRVDFIYDYYDELMASYPQYISRVNCDEIMASLGISKPTSLSNLPMYMYCFLPPRTPDGATSANSVVSRIKALVLTGTHGEYTAVWDCMNGMRLMCEDWREDKNLEELRWNADIYIIPCLNLYGVNNGTRTNENGVDINRNAPTEDWVYQGVGTQTFGGETSASEYSTKVYMEMLRRLNPDITIDHHATNVGVGDDEGDGKNMIYVHSTEKAAIDVGGAVITQMTRKWKDRYSDTFPSNDSDTTVFGFSREDTLPGSLGKYASEQGSFGSTYESNFGILYRNGEYSTEYRQTNTSLVNTCATEGFMNYLVRLLKVYSEEIGVKE